MLRSREVEFPPFRFWETRCGSGTPVVLIHGLGGSADWWRRNFEALAAARTIDLPGSAGRVVGEKGTVTLVGGGGARVPLGRGVPLAATADGRVVLALAPREGAVREGQLPWRVVLYVVD